MIIPEEEEDELNLSNDSWSMCNDENERHNQEPYVEQLDKDEYEDEDNVFADKTNIFSSLQNIKTPKVFEEMNVP